MTISRSALLISAVFALSFFIPTNALAAASDTDTAEKRFGTLGTLVGTIWDVGNEVIRIKWDRPGEGIVIEREGTFGPTDTYVVPTVDGRSLRYVRLNRTFGDRLEGEIVIPAKGRFTLRATPRTREECVQKKKAVTCTRSVPGAKGWVSDWSALSAADATLDIWPITESKAASWIKELGPDIYPDRPAGSLPADLGVLALVAGRHWIEITTGPSSTNEDAWYELASVNGKSAVLAPDPEIPGMPRPQPLLFTTSGTDGLVASPVTSGGSKLITRRVTLRASEDGAVMNCDLATGDTARVNCIEVRVSADGSRLLHRYISGSGANAKRYRRTFKEPEPIGASLPNDTVPMSFRRLWGTFYIDSEDLLWDFASGSTHSSDRSVYVSATGRDGYGAGRSIFPQENFTIAANGSLVSRNTGDVLQPITRGQYLLTRYERNIGQIRQSHEGARAFDRRQNEEFWNGFSRRVAAMSPTPSVAWQPSTAGDWSSRLPSEPGMGASISRSAPLLTPQQRAEQAELQAFQIREQLYGGGSVSSADTASSARPTASRGPENDKSRDIDCSRHNEPGCMVQYQLTLGFAAKTRNSVCYSLVGTVLLPSDGSVRTDEDFRRLIGFEISQFQRNCRSRLPKGVAGFGDYGREVDVVINSDWGVRERDFTRAKNEPESYFAGM